MTRQIDSPADVSTDDLWFAARIDALQIAIDWPERLDQYTNEQIAEARQIREIAEFGADRNLAVEYSGIVENVIEELEREQAEQTAGS